MYCSSMYLMAKLAPIFVLFVAVFIFLARIFLLLVAMSISVKIYISYAPFYFWISSKLKQFICLPSKLMITSPVEAIYYCTNFQLFSL